MYYFLSPDIGKLAASLAMSLTWALGGWLLVSLGFRLRRSERMLGGIACGLLLFITLSNLVAHLLPIPAAFWVASLSILIGGILAATHPRYRSRIVLGDVFDLRAPAALFTLTWLFQAIQRGLGIFDEYLHLPLISAMAAGDIPPHFYLNPSQSFAYHYGIHVWSASLVRVAGLTPWSAFDLARAFALGLSACLGFLYFRRHIHNPLGAFLGAAGLMLVGGARWMLVLLPSPLLSRIDAHIALANTGLDTAATVSEALARPWEILGGGPFPFPFAFHSGIFVPLIFILGSTGAMPFFTLILLLMLNRGARHDVISASCLTLILASMALSAEHLFAFLLTGVLVVVFAALPRYGPRRGRRRAIGYWALIIFASLALSLVQGGFITETARTVIADLFGSQASSYNYHGFRLRWPPGLPSAHMQELSLSDGLSTIVLLAELGPTLLIIPWAMKRATHSRRERHWLTYAIGVAACIELGFALFVRYGVDRSTTRLPGTSLWLWFLLGFPWAWERMTDGRMTERFLLIGVLATAYLGGIVIFAIQLLAIPRPQFSFFIEAIDTHYAAQYWDTLPSEAQVLDHIPYRSVTLFGRPARAHAGIYEPLDEWIMLVREPSIARVLNAGYTHIYFDRAWWSRLPDRIRIAYREGCPARMDLGTSQSNNDRRLYDLTPCLASPP